MKSDRARTFAKRFEIGAMLEHVRVVLKHKWFVLVAGRKLGVPLFQLLMHDMSKLSPAEFMGYTRRFYGPSRDDADWDQAWSHHQNRNAHHWEYWVLRLPVAGQGNTAFKVLDMPSRYVVEMIADWMAASRAYDGCWPTPDNWPWWEVRFPFIRLSPSTLDLVGEWYADWSVE